MTGVYKLLLLIIYRRKLFTDEAESSAYKIAQYVTLGYKNKY